MRHILTSVVLLVLLFPALAFGETMDELVVRDGLHYKSSVQINEEGVGDNELRCKSDDGSIYITLQSACEIGDTPQQESQDPFTGKVTGKSQGTFRNGKEDGTWVTYWDNGQLWWKGTYKDGKTVPRQQP